MQDEEHILRLPECWLGRIAHQAPSIVPLPI